MSVIPFAFAGDHSDVLAFAVVTLLAYFCGCFNGAVIVSKYILKNDIRNHGSGNAGLTNFHRTFGGGLTFVVILTDMLKAVLAVWLGSVLMGPEFGVVVGKYWAGLSCLFGHMFPCMFEFKGGKGILSGGTIAIMIDWRLALLVWGSFIILTALTRWVSLGSISAAAWFPVGTYLFVDWTMPVLLMSLFLGGLIIWKHRANAMRLIKGEESKLSFSKKKTEPETKS